jgi:hypothetical protein
MDDDDGNGVRRRRQIREEPAQDDRPLFGGGAGGQERLRELTETLFSLLASVDRSQTALPEHCTIPRAQLAELSLIANSALASVLTSGGDRQPLPELSLGGNPCIGYHEFQGYIQCLLSAVSTDELSQQLVLQHLIADVQSGCINARGCAQTGPEAELEAEPEEEPCADATTAVHQQADCSSQQ